MGILVATDDLAALIGGTTDTTAGRFDSQYTDKCMEIVQVGSNQTTARLNYGTGTTNDIWFHVEIYQTAQGDDGTLFGFYDDDDNLIASTSGSNAFWGAYVVGGSVGPREAHSLNEITVWDYHIHSDGTTMTASLYQNNGLVSRGSRTTTTPLPTRLGISYTDSGTMYMSQIAISDTPLLGRKIGTLLPNGAGTHTAWTGGFGELAGSESTSLAYTSTAATRVSSTLTAWGAGTDAPIEELSLHTIGFTSTGAPQSIAQSVLVGATDYDGASVTLSTVPTAYTTNYLINPNTGVPWTYADLPSVEIGAISIT